MKPELTRIVVGVAIAAQVGITSIGFAAGDVTLAVIPPKFVHAKHDLAYADMKTLAAVVSAETGHDPRKAERCPTIEELFLAHALTSKNAIDDPWGGRYHVECDDAEVVVSSAGRDRIWGTEDDERLAQHR